MVNMVSSSYMEEHDEHVTHGHMINPSASMVDLVLRMHDEVPFNAKDYLTSPPENLLIETLVDLQNASLSKQQSYVRQEKVQPLAEVEASWRARVCKAAMVVSIGAC
jgi:hypothetical protein